jgi:hypothetical protein
MTDYIRYNIMPNDKELYTIQELSIINDMRKDLIGKILKYTDPNMKISNKKYYSKVSFEEARKAYREGL